MRDTLVLARKEAHHIYFSPIAYAFMAVFVFYMTFMFLRAFFVIDIASMSNFFQLLPIAFAFVIPGVTMRAWAEERKQGTIEFLLTAPIQTWQIVLAKFLAGLSLIFLCLLLTIGIPITVAHFGDLDMGPVWGGYLGSLFMGGAFLAVGMFCSAFTQDQIVAFLVSVSVLLGLVLVGSPYIQSEFMPGSVIGRIARIVSPTTYFQSIGRGVIDIRDLYYFGGFTAFFLYLNTRVIDLRRWR